MKTFEFHSTVFGDTCTYKTPNGTEGTIKNAWFPFGAKDMKANGYDWHLELSVPSTDKFIYVELKNMTQWELDQWEFNKTFRPLKQWHGYYCYKEPYRNIPKYGRATIINHPLNERNVVITLRMFPGMLRENSTFHGDHEELDNFPTWKPQYVKAYKALGDMRRMHRLFEDAKRINGQFMKILDMPL